jgi:hypothetical protein
MHKNNKRVAALGVATLTVMGAGVAYAAWTATGSGPGVTQAMTAAASVVTADTATPSLYPGGPAGAVMFKITNPNPYAVTFDKLTGISVVSSNPTNCAVAGNVAVPTASTGSPYSLGANAVSVPANTTAAVARSLPGLLTLVSGATDGCQGVTFTTTLTLLGAQN